MKKILSILLSAVILLTMPVNVMAAEDTSAYTHEELVQLACQYFPDYAPLIRGEAISTYAVPNAASSSEIVYSDTRDVSDTETISISVLASGEVVIVSGVSGFEIKKENASASNVGSDIIGSTTFHVTSSVVTGDFYLKSVGFIITQSGTGNFTSYGTPSVSSSNQVKYVKNSASNTYIDYAITFIASSNQIVELEVYFSNGKVVGALKA